MGKSKVNSSVKIEYVEKYLRGEISIIIISNKLRAGESTVKQWVRNYKTFGRRESSKGKSTQGILRISSLKQCKTTLPVISVLMMCVLNIKLEITHSSWSG